MGAFLATRTMQVFLVAICIVASHGFSLKKTNLPNNLSDMLKDVPNQVLTRQLKFYVAVGDSKDKPFQMKDLVVELTNQQRVAKQFSTGLYDASLVQKPYYVNDQGEQAVDLIKGGWEIRWPNNSPHGHFTCSFISSNELQRTKEGSKLEAGRFFLNHRVWTASTLESERERRRTIQNEAAKFLDERDKEVRKITDEEEGLGSKVVSYASAAKSMNGYRTSGYKEALYVPLYDDQVLELAPNFILSTRGEVFCIHRDGRPERIGDSRVDNPNSISS